MLIRGNKSLYLAVISTMIIIHATIPKPSTGKVYECTLRRGFKGGGKVTFPSTNNILIPEITFIIQEGKHKLYKRIGNDLYTDITISITESKSGCKRIIPSLDDNKTSSIEIKIKPNTFKNGDTMKIIGKGWPINNNKNNDSDNDDNNSNNKNNNVKEEEEEEGEEEKKDVDSYGDLIVRIWVKKEKMNSRKISC